MELCLYFNEFIFFFAIREIDQKCLKKLKNTLKTSKLLQFLKLLKTQKMPQKWFVVTIKILKMHF